MQFCFFTYLSVSESAFWCVTEPAYKREKVKTLVTDMKEWESARGLQSVSASHFEDQLSGATVQILRIDTAQPLQAMDLGNSSDPYVVIWMDDWAHGAFKTEVQKRTLRPRFDFVDRPLEFPLTNEALKFLREGRLALHMELVRA